MQLAKNLLKKESLMYQDIVDLIGPPPFEKNKDTYLDQFENEITALSQKEDN